MNQKEEKEDEEIQMENVDSESDLEDKVIPENYRSQHDMLAGGAPELNEISDFDHIWAPRQSKKNKSNIIEILDNREEIEIWTITLTSMGCLLFLIIVYYCCL